MNYDVLFHYIFKIYSIKRMIDPDVFILSEFGELKEKKDKKKKGRRVYEFLRGSKKGPCCSLMDLINIPP